MYNDFGQIAEQGLLEIPRHFPGVEIDKFVVMPNHIHAIVVLGENCPSLPVVVGQYKSYVSRRIHALAPDMGVWQASFYDHVIRNQKGYEQIWLYIESNPANWNKDCFYTE